MEELLRNMDWKLFRKQKRWIVEEITARAKAGKETDMLQGILHLMDSVEDANETLENDANDPAQEEPWFEEPWYEEAWYEKDITDAMEDLGIPINRVSLQMAKDAVSELFDDNTDRNEKLIARIASLFGAYTGRIIWQDFLDVPTESGCITKEWNGFPEGTPRHIISEWFQKTYRMTVDELFQSTPSEND